MSDKLNEYEEITNALNAEEIIKWALSEFTNIVTATSFGMEDQVVTNIVMKEDKEMPLFTLDTGRLFEESYDIWQKTELKYGINIKAFCPNTNELETLIKSQGVRGFINSVENRKECCAVRKMTGLGRALQNNEAWITGLRSEQAVTRGGLKAVEWDSVNGLYKINPLHAWSEEDLDAYIKEEKIDIHELHGKGYPSIGCACCTRAIEKGEDIRAGRWWWESPEQKECGLHKK